MQDETKVEEVVTTTDGEVNPSVEVKKEEIHSETPDMDSIEATEETPTA